MPTADELRAGIAGGQEVLRAAIISAADNWEVAKGEAEDGEAGWSPRQAAEHVIGSHIMFAGMICGACGYDGPENPLSGTDFASADEALAALDAVTAAFDSKIKYVQDDELGKSAGGEGFAAAPAGMLMHGVYWHLADHAAQISNPF